MGIVTNIIIALLCLCFSDICHASSDGTNKWIIANYRVERSDTLSSLSQKLGVSVNVLRSMNHIRKDSIRAGAVLHYPEIGNSFAGVTKDWTAEKTGAIRDNKASYRIYTAKNVFYLMIVEDDIEEYRKVRIFRKDDSAWKELDHFTSPYSGIYRSKPKLIIKDLNQDGNDECFYFAKYVGSSKDYGVEGISHVPTLQENSLHGLEVNIHIFNLVAQESEGYPSQSEQIENIGNQNGTGYEQYDAYIMKVAKKILMKE